jgi:hypothetical protein
MSLFSELIEARKASSDATKLLDEAIIGDGPRIKLTVTIKSPISSGPLSVFSIHLVPFQENVMDITLSIGHTLTDAIGFYDQNNNPMLTTPTPDSAPVWSDTTPATETLVAAANGLTATGTPLAVGSDVVSLTVIVGGVTFTATQNVTVTAAPQVLTSVQILPTVN